MTTATTQTVLNSARESLTNGRSAPQRPEDRRRTFALAGAITSLIPVYHLTRLDRDAANHIHCAAAMAKWYLAQSERGSDRSPEEILDAVLWASFGRDGEDSARGSGSDRSNEKTDDQLVDRVSSALRKIEVRKAILGFIPLLGPIASLLANVKEARRVEREAETVVESM